MAHREVESSADTELPVGLIIGVMIVCVFAFILSFLSLQSLAVRAGANADFAFLMPLAIDVQTMVSTWAWLHPRLTQSVRRAAEKITWMSFGLSALGNATEHLIIAMAGDKPWWMIITSVLVGMIPPVAMATTVHLASLIITERAKAVADAERAAREAAARHEEAVRKAAERDARRATPRATGSATPAATGSATAPAATNGHSNGHPFNGHPVTPPAPAPTVRLVLDERRTLETAADNNAAPAPPPAETVPAPAAAPADAGSDKSAAIEKLIADHVAGGGDIHDRTQLKGSELAAQVGASPQLGRRVLGRARAAATTASTGKEVSS